jgi:hypothetical protein
MAFKYTKTMPRIGNRMAAGNREISDWLIGARYCKTSNGYWLAWHEKRDGRIALLEPNHPEGQECYWLENLGDDTIDSAIQYVESGEYEKDGFSVLNLQILNPETGEWE